MKSFSSLKTVKREVLFYYYTFSSLLVRKFDGTTTQYHLTDGQGRVLQRSTLQYDTPLTVYAFGSDEHDYTATGQGSNNLYYYSLGGRLIGGMYSSETDALLTDAEGSVLSRLTTTAGSAIVKGNQVYSPYGSKLYSSGSMATTRGFTGQYKDATGLNYYNARYYDSVAGRFISADTVQGNPQGMDPYAYVGGNPETFNDPTGHCGSWDWGCYANIINVGYNNANKTLSGMVDMASNAVHGAEQHVPGLSLIDSFLGINDMLNDFKTMANGNIGQKLLAGIDLAFNVVSDVTLVLGVGELAKGAAAVVKWGVKSLAKVGAEGLAKGAGKAAVKDVAKVAADACGGGLSFAFATKVATAQGEQSIGNLNVGQKVWSYNQQSKKMELQPILHVWINHDNDLVDLTIASTVPGKKGHADQQTTEVIHTNKKHPFLTQEAGFVQVADLNVGMHLIEADGNVGVITGWIVVPGAMTMYNLEVAQDHTFTVGDGQWVVHNAGPGCSGEIVTVHSDAESAYKYVMDQIGGPLGDNAVPNYARGLAGDPNGVQGLKNGMREGRSSWRLDYDPEKGPHYNWSVGKKGSGIWGAATFPGTLEDYVNMLLNLNE